MCGTSLDGLDLAMIRTDGNKIFSFGSSKFTEFNNEERKKLKLALGKWPGEEYTAEATEIIEKIHSNKSEKYNYGIFNFGAHTHTNIAIRDAILSVKLPFYEVHISNIYAREEFRHHSFFSDIAIGSIVGFGLDGYEFALTKIIRGKDGS